MLLESSGELPADGKAALQRHLAECGDCRGFMADMKAIVRLVERAAPDSMPSHDTIEQILAKGRLVTDRRPSYIFTFTARRLLAVAAGFMVVAAGVSLLAVVHTRLGSAAHGLRVSQMGTIMAMVAEDESAAAEAAAHGDIYPDMRALAAHILQVEGLAAEEQADNEETIPGEDEQPRDLQSRSTSGSQPAECA